MPIDYTRISSVDLEKFILEENVIVVIPLGSIEQHCNGPLGLDSMIAERLSHEACKRLEEKNSIKCILMPTIYYGYSPEWSKVKGTISIPLHVYKEFLEAIIESLANWGFRRVVLINAHGGNVSLIEATLRSIASKREDLILALVNYWELLDLKLDHAGPLEEHIAKSLGLSIELGECSQVGYESKPRIITKTPQQPSRIIFEDNVIVDLEKLIEALAEALERIASTSLSKHLI